MRMQRLLLVVLFAGTCGSGCAPLLLSRQDDDTSSEFEPPQSWESAVTFSFADSSWIPGLQNHGRIEFFDGRRLRKASGRDLQHHPNGGTGTPWYRLWLPRDRDFPATFRITLENRSGDSVRIEYRLDAAPGQFYQVGFGIQTIADPDLSSPPPSPWIVEGMQTYPVPVGMRSRPTDVLWVNYVRRPRECFRCLR